MTLVAMCPCGVLSRNGVSAQHVHLMCNWLHVSRIYAGTHSASVIEFHPFRHRADVALVENEVSLTH